MRKIQHIETWTRTESVPKGVKVATNESNEMQIQARTESNTHSIIEDKWVKNWWMNQIKSDGQFVNESVNQIHI